MSSLNLSSPKDFLVALAIIAIIFAFAKWINLPSIVQTIIAIIFGLVVCIFGIHLVQSL